MPPAVAPQINNWINLTPSVGLEQPQPDACLPATTQWQSSEHLPERRLMVQRVMNMTKYNGQIRISPQDWDTKAPAIARRVELSLYSRAASLEEYLDLQTLRRRLQSLVALSYHEAAAIATASSRKRKYHEWIDASNKVRRIEAHSKGYLCGNDDILRHIYSFVNGTEAIQHRSVNRYAAAIIPSCVSSLVVECEMIDRGFQQHSPSLLNQFPNLTSLQIYNSTIESPDNSNNTLHAWACAELNITHSNLGETVVTNLAEAISNGACKKLQVLSLLSLFTNTTQVNGIRVLCSALRLKHLSELYLGGNSISDAGVADLSRLLQSGVFPKLEKLDLRRNYIGEAGVRVITSALSAGKCGALQQLCLGGNIVTDKSVPEITTMLSSSVCPAMRFLGLEDNFISTQGVQKIIQAAMDGGMMPKLHKVCHRDAEACKCNKYDNKSNLE